MKVLCTYTASGPSHVRSGWGRAFVAAGHQFMFWQPEAKSAFDAFSEYEPDIFLGTTYDLDAAQMKCIARRPHLKVALFASAWGPYLNDVDLKKYPLVVATEQEKVKLEKFKRETGRPDFVFIHAHDRWLEGTMSGWGTIGIPYVGILNAADTFLYMNGKYRPELACDVGMVGGYWGYKARNLDRSIIQLCNPTHNLRVKIFGNANWPVPQYMGMIKDEYVKDLFCSATVCPNVSEPHSTDLGWDVIERPFKVISSGGYCISDYIEEARDLFTEDELPMFRDYHKMVEYIKDCVHTPSWDANINETKRLARIKVFRDHTYFERVGQMLDMLGLPTEKLLLMETKKKWIPELN